MAWFLVIFAAFFGAVGTYAQKTLVTRMNPARIIAVNFAIVFAMVAVGTIFSHGMPGAGSFDIRIGALAAINVFAAYLYLIAIRANVTKSVLLSPLSLVVSTLIGVMLFDEWHLLHPATRGGIIRIIGIIAAIAALAMFGQKNNTALSPHAHRSWTIAAAGAMIIWGMVNALIKAFAVDNVPEHIFLFSWYASACAAALLLFAIYRYAFRQEFKAPEKNPTNTLFLFLLAFLTVGSMWFFFLVAKDAPSVFLFPVHDVMKYGGSAAIGLFLFGERHRLSRREWLGVLSGTLAIAAFIIVPLL